MRIDRADVSKEDWVYSMQLQDKALQETVLKIQQGDKQEKKEFILEKGRLMELMNGRKLYVLPKNLRYKAIIDAHESGGHLSAERTISKIQQLMWFPRMQNCVKSVLKSCIDCAYNKKVGGKTEGEYHYRDIEPVPFKKNQIYHLGPFPRRSRRMEHIIVMVDAFTKYLYMKLSQAPPQNIHYEQSKN